MWLFIISTFAAFLVLIPVVLAFFTLFLAAITTWRRRHNRKEFNTALYVGRVSHSRLLPVVHSFNYPLFMCAVDLEEVEELWGRGGALWPLSTIMSFRIQDHYKNGEGGTESRLTAKTFHLVKERTNNKFQPTFETHCVVLVTHLCYYGYCFNPVSFYYILDRKSRKTNALVLEVSNTPWNEMQCYALHPDSVDVERVQPGRPKTSDDGKTTESTNFEFKKTFHVSPFMEMDYMYDWTFWELSNGMISLHASMKKGGVRQFTANVDITGAPFTPFRLAWQLIQFPIYCFIIQIWIHVEAFWLFKKGVAYQPHPKGSETTASRLIGSIMTPIFALKDWMQSLQSERSSKED
jgi:hypothetical protein